MACGLWFSWQLKFIQLRHFSHMFSILKSSRKSSARGISPFQALCTTLATGLMTMVNVTALFLLGKVVVAITRDYHQKLKLNQVPAYKVDEAEEKELGLTRGIWR